MIVRVNTDHNILNDAALSARIAHVVEAALSHRSDRITRVEVHVSDQNSDKKQGEGQMRCMMEARLEGRAPLAVTSYDTTVIQAVDAAAERLVHLIDNTLGRAHDIAIHAT